MIQSAVPQKLYELALVLVAHQPSDKLTHVDTLTVADIDLLQTWRQEVDERGRGKKKSEGRHENSDVGERLSLLRGSAVRADDPATTRCLTSAKICSNSASSSCRPFLSRNCFSSSLEIRPSLLTSMLQVVQRKKEKQRERGTKGRRGGRSGGMRWKEN